MASVLRLNGFCAFSCGKTLGFKLSPQRKGNPGESQGIYHLQCVIFFSNLGLGRWPVLASMNSTFCMSTGISSFFFFLGLSQRVCFSAHPSLSSIRFHMVA
jgi:hypothetical protein